MSRHAVIAERERAVAAAARAPDRLTLRRQRFIRAQRLSLPEVALMPPEFDPGPEYDLDYTQRASASTQEKPL